jgi:molybdate transport system substrate-binding protein
VSRSRRSAVAMVLAFAAVACGGEASSVNATDDEVTVFAASSLTDAFTEIGTRFEAEQGVSVAFNFLSSSDLSSQIEQGAQADVFASADEENMQKVVDSAYGDAEPVVFARNTLEIVVPAGNPAGIRSLADLEDDGLVISLCNDECPAGAYARTIFHRAGVRVEADSLETEVKGVVTRVAVGEADAGIVYKTDVEAARDDVEGIDIPAEVNVVAEYPIAALKNESAAATDFVEYVVSREGRTVLRKHGFLVE